MADLHARLSNGNEHVLDSGEDTSSSLMEEIIQRTYFDEDGPLYEWCATTEGKYVRVEAIDELWLTE